MDNFDDMAAEPGFFRRRRALVLAFAFFAIGGGVVAVKQMTSREKEAPRKVQKIVMIKVEKPEPPPIPQPPIAKTPKVETTYTQATASPPSAKPPTPPTPPAEPLATNTGRGTDDFRLGTGRGGGGSGGPSSPGGGSELGSYFGQVQTTISEALRKNHLTRNASLHLNVRIWPDATGRIAKAKLAESTGDAKLDEVIQNEILTRLQLSQPPAGMKSPIRLLLSERRPN
jgi:protein TonB